MTCGPAVFGMKPAAPAASAPRMTVLSSSEVITTTRESPTEAPTGFDGESNGLTDAATFDEDRAAFDGAEDADEGLGPIYNAQACRECHQSPISGAASQITELRVGYRDSRGNFVDPDIPLGDGTEVVRGRSLVNDRSICPSAEFPDLTGQQRVPPNVNVRAPDIAVTCIPKSPNEKFFPDPVLIIEVLSPGNQRETWESIWACATIPTVQEVMVVDSERVHVTVSTKDANGEWPLEPEVVQAGGTARLASIDADISLADIYADTNLV